MSTKAPVKKTKRRLKRSIRRSIAAVLMVTAIGVAAVPVPENFATDGTDPSGNGTTTSTVGDYHDMSGYKYDPKNNQDESMYSGTNFSLSKYKEKDVDTLIQEPDVLSSLYVTDVGGGSYDLCWQFMYYEVKEPHSGATRGVICKYNDQYFADEVNLSLNPITEYYTVEQNRYDSFYAGTLTDNNMSSDPTQAVLYTYSDYINNTLPDNDKEFFIKYFKEAYDAKEKEFAEYKKAKEVYDRDQTRYPDPGAAPADLSKVPSNDLTPDQKLQYYCEHDKKLLRCGTGYTLRSVGNSMPGKTGSIYLAQGGSPTEGYSNDDKGFLVVSKSDYLMCAIGDGAFKGVTKVVNMEIPPMIGYIGDEAFADATLMESIKINNVEKIGNRAFKGCTKLATVEIAQSTQCIGEECFSNTAIQSITLPVSIDTIGYGAFANCQKLTTVDLNNIRADCVVKDYAFYNCSALQTINMKDSAIKSIGDGAFAVETGSQPLDVVFPKEMSASDSIGDYMFAGRAGLKSVVFPANIGRSASAAITLPKNMFHGCANLEYVEFPTDSLNDPQACGFVKFPEVNVVVNGESVSKVALFLDVINPDFYVKGPKINSSGDEAFPRSGTWNAMTAVSDTVPYMYVENGKEYYEVSDGKFLLCVNNQGVLTSGTFVPNLSDAQKSNVTLEIKPTVGKMKVTSIASDCFKDDEFNQAVKILNIYDDSISAISANAFYGWKKLQEVKIGNSVTSIGDSAFEGCESLIDVTFNTPLGGHDSFAIGNDAFKTGSTELTFHGDIVEGYAPFEWAMDENNLINVTDGIRVCYKSLTPTYLTVMYDANTRLVTLLDYPKYDQISDVLNDAHSIEIASGNYGSYENMMESRYYEIYKATEYDSYRKAFAEAWKAAVNDTVDPTAAKAAVYASSEYGPWVNSDFCNNWQTFLTSSNNTEEPTVLTALADMLFEPLVVEAADNPVPFYTTYPYDVIQNAESGNIYRAPTEEERALVEATKNIVVPTGVESIDAYGFSNGEGMEAAKNKNNARIYLDRDRIGTDSYNMYNNKNKTDENTVTDITPGLFSGYYYDKYSSGETNYEQYKRGNDRVESVTLNNVKYLPDYAFDSCERLQYVILGPDCKDIGTAPFRGCYSLISVGDNDYYKTENGIVYSVNVDESYTIEECLPARGNLVGGAQVSVSTDPNLANVSAIQEGAFEECKYINLVDLSEADDLVAVPKDCFKNCSDLTRLALPRSVNNIEEGAFVNDLKLVELTVPGTEVFISARAFESDDAKAWTMVRTYEDSSARRYADTYSDEYKLTYEQISDQWKVVFLDSDLNQVGDPIYVDDNTYISEVPECPAKANWTFEKWLGTNNVEVSDKITSDTTFVAQGYSDSGMVNGKYTVMFIDQVDGKQIGATQYIEPGKAAIAPQAPVHSGYTFQKWSSEEYSNVQKNLTILAMYTGGTGTTSGGTTNTSGGTTNTSGNTTSTSATSTSSSTSSTSTSTSSTSATSTTAAATGQYVVTVIGGSGSGSYAPGATVIITANTPAAGKVFSKWTTESQGVTLASVSVSPTTFVMPSNNVTITAEYTDGATTSTASTVTGTANNNNNNNADNTQDGNTRVDITKPGISNKDLATANVNGSSDNFIVKISETQEATQAVASALTNKYGSLENILYYAMDISLYDSTGTTKITDTTGLSVDITIPIPDALLSYGGNNMAGAVVDYNPVENAQLEELSEKFTTINGVPCVTFTATHFSPYTVYVDTGNLTEGLLDVTPKTGDPIHPKWFLSLGLACLSIILFIKKDKNAAKTRMA